MDNDEDIKNRLKRKNGELKKDIIIVIGFFREKPPFHKKMFAALEIAKRLYDGCMEPHEVALPLTMAWWKETEPKAAEKNKWVLPSYKMTEADKNSKQATVYQAVKTAFYMTNLSHEKTAEKWELEELDITWERISTHWKYATDLYRYYWILNGKITSKKAYEDATEAIEQAIEAGDLKADKSHKKLIQRWREKKQKELAEQLLVNYLGSVTNSKVCSEDKDVKCFKEETQAVPLIKDFLNRKGLLTKDNEKVHAITIARKWAIQESFDEADRLKDLRKMYTKEEAKVHASRIKVKREKDNACSTLKEYLSDEHTQECGLDDGTKVFKNENKAIGALKKYFQTHNKQHTDDVIKFARDWAKAARCPFPGLQFMRSREELKTLRDEKKRKARQEMDNKKRKKQEQVENQKQTYGKKQKTTAAPSAAATGASASIHVSDASDEDDDAPIAQIAAAAKRATDAAAALVELSTTEQDPTSSIPPAAPSTSSTEPAPTTSPTEPAPALTLAPPTEATPTSDGAKEQASISSPPKSRGGLEAKDAQAEQDPTSSSPPAAPSTEPTPTFDGAKEQASISPPKSQGGLEAKDAQADSNGVEATEHPGKSQGGNVQGDGTQIDGTKIDEKHLIEVVCWLPLVPPLSNKKVLGTGWALSGASASIPAPADPEKTVLKVDFRPVVAAADAPKLKKNGRYKAPSDDWIEEVNSFLLNLFHLRNWLECKYGYDCTNLCTPETFLEHQWVMNAAVCAGFYNLKTMGTTELDFKTLVERYVRYNLAYDDVCAVLHALSNFICHGAACGKTKDEFDDIIDQVLVLNFGPKFYAMMKSFVHNLRKSYYDDKPAKTIATQNPTEPINTTPISKKNPSATTPSTV